MFIMMSNMPKEKKKRKNKIQFHHRNKIHSNAMSGYWLYLKMDVV